ncbi:MAG: WD40/YVTN/BNR-like repeat-containing protein [Gammaproteobacteria bacterium]
MKTLFGSILAIILFIPLIAQATEKSWKVFSKPPISSSATITQINFSYKQKILFMLVSENSRNVLYYSQDNGKSWIKDIQADDDFLKLVNDPQGNAIYAYTQKALYKFTGMINPATHSYVGWSRVMSNNKIAAVAVNENGVIAVYGEDSDKRDYNEVYISDTMGQNWQRLGYNKPAIISSGACSIAIDRQANIYIDNGFVLSIYPQGQKTWKVAKYSSRGSSNNSIAIDSHNSVYVINDLQGAVKVSRDSGATWQDLFNTRSPIPIQKISIDKNNNLYMTMLQDLLAFPASAFSIDHFTWTRMGNLLATQIEQDADGNIYGIAKQDTAIYQWN